MAATAEALATHASTDGADQQLVELHQVASIVVLTKRWSRVVIGDADTVRRAYRRAQAITLLLGWWGIPFGLIWTPLALLHNRNAVRHAGSPGAATPPANRPVVKALAAVLVVGLVGLLATQVVRGADGADDEAVPTSSAAPTPAPAPVESNAAAPSAAAPAPAGTSVAEVLPGLVAFVEHERGLRFKTAVAPVLLDDESFRSRITADDATQTPEREAAHKAELRVVESSLKALGLIRPDADLESDVEDFLGDAVLGVYDPASHELLVRGGSMTPGSKATLVHELTHALDDQHFRLHRPDLDEKGILEEADAFRSLVEGDAQRVEAAYVRAMSPADRAVAEAETSGVDTPLANDPIAVSLAFPYQFGQSFVEGLLELGGQDQLDRAFQDPPTTTAEIVFPERYLAHVSGALLTSPRSDGEPMLSGMFGVDDLLALLSPTASGDELALVAATWEGDKAIAWSDGGRSCAEIRMLFSSAEATEVVSQILRRWAATQPDARVEKLATVSLTSCRQLAP